MKSLIMQHGDYDPKTKVFSFRCPTCFKVSKLGLDDLNYEVVTLDCNHVIELEQIVIVLTVRARGVLD